MIHKATLKIKSESLMKLCEELLSDVSEQYKSALKLEERLRVYHSNLNKKVLEL